MPDHDHSRTVNPVRGLDRRRFIQSAGALGFGAAFAGTRAGRAFASTAPRAGGHMRFAIGHGDTTDTLNPWNVANGFVAATHFTVTNMLTEVDGAGNLVPKLAESWEGAAGASRWTFKLREGVTFHDGRDVTARDVIASINHHRGEESQSSAKTTVDPITDIRADGDHVVVIQLNAGDADFPFKLSSYSFPVYPANDDGSMNWQSGIGCGGYMLKEFEPGVRARFERYPDFWQRGERAHFDSCELIAVIDVVARHNALVTGEVDGIDRVDLKTARLLGQRPGVVVEEVPGKTHYTFPMRTDVAPFDNPDVRLALKYALDRDALLQSILVGHGTLGNDHPISSAYVFSADDIPQHTYDPDKAKFHLGRAGLTSLSVELSASDAAFAGAVDAATLYREHAAAAGIDISVVREAADGYWSNVWMQKPWCACYWPGTATPDGIFTQAYSKGAAWNDTYWANERFNALLLEARASLDNAKRQELYREMQLLVNEDGGAVVPLFANDVFATSDKVGHGMLSNNLEIDGRMFFERWWFA